MLQCTCCFSPRTVKRDRSNQSVQSPYAEKESACGAKGHCIEPSGLFMNVLLSFATQMFSGFHPLNPFLYGGFPLNMESSCPFSLVTREDSGCGSSACVCVAILCLALRKEKKQGETKHAWVHSVALGAKWIELGSWWLRVITTKPNRVITMGK